MLKTWKDDMWKSILGWCSWEKGKEDTDEKVNVVDGVKGIKRFYNHLKCGGLLALVWVFLLQLTSIRKSFFSVLIARTSRRNQRCNICILMAKCMNKLWLSEKVKLKTAVPLDLKQAVVYNSRINKFCSWRPGL